MMALRLYIVSMILVFVVAGVFMCLEVTSVPTIPSKLVVVDRFYHRPTWRKTLKLSGSVELAKTEPSYIAVCIDSAGTEWNVELTAKEFFVTHIGDSLGSR